MSQPTTCQPHRRVGRRERGGGGEHQGVAMRNGWPKKMLADVCDVFADGDWVESKDQSSHGIRLIQTGNVGGGVFKDRGEKARYISEATFRRLRCTEIFEGDCLISRLPDPVGRSCILPDTGERMITAVDCTIVRFNSMQLLPGFFNFYSQSLDYLKAVDSVTTGTTRNRISRSNLGLIPIPVPPLPEQQRIVGILDEAFEGIATAKANAERNLQNARALFESHLQSVFTRRGEGGVEKRLGEIAESISTGPFGTMLHKSDYVTDGIPLVNPMNIVDSRIIPSSKMMVNEETRERLRSYVLKAGDIVIGRRGELGRCALVTEREEGWLCGTGSFFVRLSDCMDGKFFVALFGSQQFRSTLEGSAVGTTMSSLNHGILNDLRLPIPPIAVQKKEMAKADELLAKTQWLASIQEQKLAALDALKKSLLHQAFSGEL